MELLLELKLLADVALVGYPNVGKSTLISVVSEAKPQVANYPFTTLSPVLGVVRLGTDRSFVIADIPGLIEGASEGTGLGHEFLRHVERCRLLVHIVDVSGSEGRDPKQDFAVINSELAKYNPQLMERPMLVAGNKCDLAAPEQIGEFRRFVEKQGYEFFPITAAIRDGVDPLLGRIAALLSTLPPIRRFEPEPAPQAAPEGRDGREIAVVQRDGAYSVQAPWIEEAMRSVNFADPDSFRYFQQLLERSGVFDVLRQAGVKEGDTVEIYGLEFDFVE